MILFSLLRLCPIVGLLLLSACSIGKTPPTMPISTPPASSVTAQVIVLTSTAIPRTATAPQPGPLPATTATAVSSSGPRTGTSNPTGPPPVTTNAQARKLTNPGCCVGPHWLPDGSGVYFFAASGQVDQRAGVFTVPRAGGAPQFLTSLNGAFSSNLKLVAHPTGEGVAVSQISGATVAVVPDTGRHPAIAPTNDQVAWMAPTTAPLVSVSLDPPFQIAIQRLGTGVVNVPAGIWVGENFQWFPDGRRILVQGRDSHSEQPGLWVLDTTTGAVSQIVAGSWLENVAISPDSRQIVYTATLQPDRAANGVWLINADGSGRRQLAGLSGGYHWLPDNSGLVYIPSPTEQPTDELWRYTLRDNSRTPLITRDRTPFSVAQDDWELAPDGKAVVFRSATDGAIWVIQFAP